MIRKIKTGILALCGCVFISCSTSTESLTANLKKEDPKIRLDAVHALGERGDPAAVGPLVELIHSSGDDFSLVSERIAGCVALGKIGGVALNELLALIRDKKTDVHTSQAAISALGRAGHNAVPHLAELLTGEDLHY